MDNGARRSIHYSAGELRAVRDRMLREMGPHLPAPWPEQIEVVLKRVEEEEAQSRLEVSRGPRQQALPHPAAGDQPALASSAPSVATEAPAAATAAADTHSLGTAPVETVWTGRSGEEGEARGRGKRQRRVVVHPPLFGSSGSGHSNPNTRSLLGVLNKLSPENFDPLVVSLVQMMQAPSTRVGTLRAAARAICTKAANEPQFGCGAAAREPACLCACEPVSLHACAPVRLCACVPACLCA